MCTSVIGHRAGSDAGMRRSARGVSLYVILSYVTYHPDPRSVIAPGSEPHTPQPAPQPARPVGQLRLVSLTLRRTQLHSPQYTLMAGN